MDLSAALALHRGVAHVRTLRALRVPAWTVRIALANEAVSRPRRGWVAAADADPELRAAVAAGGRLGCVSAAAALGFWVDEPIGRHLSLPRHSGHARPPAGAVAHWRGANWSAGLLPIDPIEQIVADVPNCVTAETALALIESAVHAGSLSLRTARDILSADHRSRLAMQLDGGSGSGLETLVRVRLRRIGIPVRTQFPIGLMHVDLLVGDRLVIECDGRGHHDDPGAWARDRARDLRLAAAGYHVVRLGYAQVMHTWELSFAVIRSLVERGEHRWTATHRRAGLA